MPSTTATAKTTDPALEPASRRVARHLLLGAAAAVVGLLPWLVSGMRLPLQNLWATPTDPGDMPLALLPFSQYEVALIPALLVVGGAVAGVVQRARARAGLGAVALGLLLVQGVAVAQTALVVGRGLQQRTESALYLAALVGLSAVSLLVGALTMVLIARAPKAGALLGLGAAILLLQPWVWALLTASGTLPRGVTDSLYVATRWLPAVLIGVALAWAGLRTAGRVVAALAVLLGLWIVPALMTAVSNAVGSRVLARDLPAMLEYGTGVFGAALTTPVVVVPPLVVAVAVAAVGLLVRGALSVARPATPVGTDPT